ncbi:MAG: PEP-utilizing enzyme [Solirubrobacteraceae bacterium MAG38_C4-C5]|nr:PEP-utilizing enzyme [Candidatus Siliceabacter maunaloa]
MIATADPLHSIGAPTEHWTTANLGEALPGVATPLSATVWAGAVDKGIVAGAVALGALSAAEGRLHLPPSDRLVRFFHGRAAVKVDFLALLGDRMPGTTGPDVVRALFGEVPPTMAFAPTVRRYPSVAIGLPRSFTRHPRAVRALASEWDGWWASSVPALADADLPAAVRALRDASVRLEQAVIAQSVVVLTCVQPVYDALDTVVARFDGDLSLLSAPSGRAESAVVADIWAASRGTLQVEQVARRHGFHGPAEGELSSRVWREDPAILTALVERYARRPDTDAPAVREAAHAVRRREEAARLLAAAGRLRAPAVRALLGLVDSRIPLRGAGKRSMLQSLDVARAAARRVGHHLAAGGHLDAPDDVMLLTLSEVTDPPAELRELVLQRRAAREAHAAVTLPEQWRGSPPLDHGAPPAQGATVRGEGVSAGVVEGYVRVVHDPSFTEVEDDEILVAPTTDPSWASIMFVSSVLVVDIGGALSHAAVVARELGIPCVVNTRSGSRDLRTGDRVRVDGSTGIVDVLERA